MSISGEHVKRKNLTCYKYVVVFLFFSGSNQRDDRVSQHKHSRSGRDDRCHDRDGKRQRDRERDDEQFLEVSQMLKFTFFLCDL